MIVVVLLLLLDSGHW